MYGFLSSVGWFFLTPSNLLVVTAAAGLALTVTGVWVGTGKLLAVIAVAGLLVAGFSSLGNILILPLEERFPRWAEGEGGSPDGIVVLGGSFVTGIGAARDSVELNESGERMTEFAALARRYPGARLVFSGGAGGGGVTESEAAARLLAEIGIEPARVAFEDRSRNTWENAVFTRALVSPGQGERWLLVTSAWHMPRAIGSFRAAGFEVEAYPVDYRTRGRDDAWRGFSSVSEGLRRIDTTVREWIGLAVYRLIGRSPEFLPGP